MICFYICRSHKPLVGLVSWCHVLVLLSSKINDDINCYYIWCTHKTKVNIVYRLCNRKYCFVAVRGDITRVPENVATKVRQRVTLQCAGDSRLDWEKFIEGHVVPDHITYAGEVLEKHKNTLSLNTDGGQFDLVIKSAALSDGTTYQCKDVADSIEQNGDAEVIVFGKTYFPIVLRLITNFLKR